MIKEKISVLSKKLFLKNNDDNKKNIENLIVFLVLLIITIIAINVIWGDNEEKKENSNYVTLAEETNSLKTSNNTKIEEYNLKTELEDILSKIQGVGKVNVLITYSETSTVSAMYNEKQTTSMTQENDTSGGTRTIESADIDKKIVMNGDNLPITEKIIMPKIEGAIIAAEGGGNITVKANIMQAVSAVTGLPSHKIQVFEMSV